jgi:hypothetical protein
MAQRSVYRVKYTACRCSVKPGGIGELVAVIGSSHAPRLAIGMVVWFGPDLAAVEGFGTSFLE